jgi:hypothetical protein
MPYRNEDVARIVQTKELGYVVQYYLDGNDIIDPVLRDMFLQAKVYLDAIDALLARYEDV